MRQPNYWAPSACSCRCARITPVLTPGAAGALAMIMLLATAFHRSRREYFALPITLALGALAAFVAWGRLHRAPIVAR